MDLLPYLLIKRPKAELILRWIELKERRPRGGKSHWTEGELKEEREIISQFDLMRYEVKVRSRENRPRPTPGWASGIKTVT